MNRRDHRIIARRKKKLLERLRRRNFANQSGPMFRAESIRFEMGDRVRAIGSGGIGAIHLLASRIGLPAAINERVHVLREHKPYFESDHVLNLAFNVMAGGTCLDDIELLRNDEAYMDALGAERIPDPTTAGDFLRRFDERSIVELQEAINEARMRVWTASGETLGREAIVDVDGTIAGTLGERKEGMDMSYKGVWGYAPLIVSLANTNEVLYLVNRPGSAVSHEGSVPWIDRAIELVGGAFEKITLRGDTDFALTKNFDRWDSSEVRFVFGFDAKPNVVKIADELADSAWRKLKRGKRVRTGEREQRKNVKDRIVKEREYETIRLEAESVAEFEYEPGACEKPYRMIVVRKDLGIHKGQQRLFDDERYFFYITNDWKTKAAAVVNLAMGRCNQENVIGQLKNGVNAMRMPSSDLNSNWAYMVMAGLAWNLKAWFGLMVEDPATRRDVLGMEFKRFSNSFLRIACQILTTGRQRVFRILQYTETLTTFLKTFDRIKWFAFG